LNFPFNNKDKTVGEYKQVVLQTVSLDERQAESVKESHALVALLVYNLRKVFLIISAFPFIRRYLREAKRRLYRHALFIHLSRLSAPEPFARF
jgi:hypothetical protein